MYMHMYIYVYVMFTCNISGHVVLSIHVNIRVLQEW